jgi:glycosyltransferase involved in cell wall biosynthesis
MNGNDQVNNPLISIIINCYNGEEFLKEAIDSVFAQSYSHWEIIFWDNASSDNSASISKAYGPKIKYFLAPENRPLGEARRAALQKASGEYLCFIDCDDIWLPDKLEVQVKLMEANKDFILCYGSIEEILHSGEFFRTVITIYESGFILEKLLLQFDVNILTSMIRSSLLQEAGLTFDPKITASEEYCLFMQLASIYHIGVIKEVLAKYRVHPTSLTSKSLIKLGDERRYTLQKILAVNPGLNARYPAAFKEAFARANYYEARWFMENGKHIAAFKKMTSTAGVGIRYSALAVLTLLPLFLWKKIHLKYRNRI